MYICILLDKTIGINMTREKIARNNSLTHKIAVMNDDTEDLEKRFKHSMELTSMSFLFSGNIKSLTTMIPEHWCILELSIDLDMDTLLVIRISQGQVDSLCLPLHRRRMDTNTTYSPQTARLWLDRLNDLLRKSHESTRNVDLYTTKQKKMEWWNVRNALDIEMKELVYEIENAWLGAFKVRTKNFFCSFRLFFIEIALFFHLSIRCFLPRT
jgi:hypothetical protein